jgi:hypothetical protein
MTGRALLATVAESYFSAMSAAASVVAFASEVSRRVQEDQNRADFMEFLYNLDERSSPGHPRHHTYTGLFQDYALCLGIAALQDISKEWHLEQSSAERESSDEGASGDVEP